MVPKPILVIQTAFFGDLLLTIPLLKTLREIYPQNPLHLLCRAPFAGFFRAAGLVDVAVEVNKRNKASWKLGREQLRSVNYWKIVCPHKSLTSALLSKSLSAEQKIGYRLWWNGWTFDKRVKRPMTYPEVIRQLWMIKDENSKLAAALEHYALNFEPQLAMRLEHLPGREDSRYVPSWSSMQLFSEAMVASAQVPKAFADEKNAVESLLLDQGFDELPKTTISIAPGSVWPTKRWDKFDELARSLVAEGWTILLTGAENERDVCERVKASNDKILNLAGTTSAVGSYWLLRRSRLLVSNDSGAMHLASSAQVPVVSIFGPTTLDIGYRPWQNQALVVQRDLPCRPCGLHGGQKCPLKTHQCMKDISVADVRRAIQLILDNTPG